MKRFLASLFAVGLGLALTTAVYAETAGDKVDRGVDKTKDAAHDAKDTAKDTGETVKDKTKSAMEKVKDKTKEMKDRITHKKDEGVEDHHRTSMRTSSANDVMSAQQALKDKGHDPGAIDGRMGPNTRAALKSYQKSEGLKETGRLDSETRTHLGLASSTSSAVTPSASPATSSTMKTGPTGAPMPSDTRGDTNVTATTPPNPPATATEKGVTSTKKQQP
jgi:polyhydroxyalkanoate synthesis regulator phasin